MLTKLIILSAAIFPLFPKRDQVRGCHGVERLPPPRIPMPKTEAIRPTMTASPRQPGASVPDPSRTRSGPVRDASEINIIPLVSKTKNASADLDTYWDRVDGLKIGSARAFSRWMREHDLSGDLSLRELMSFYTEFCWTLDLRPLSERSLLNRLKKAGFETSRPPATIVEGKLHRPTVYRLKRQQRRAAA